MMINIIFSYIHKESIKTFCATLLLTLIMNCPLRAQVSISGPQCIIPGNPCQYIITGNWTSDSWMKVCLKGGRMESEQQCSIAGKITHTILVTWSDTSHHKLELSSSLGNIILELKATTELRGGEINQEDKVKISDSTVTKYVFRCSPAKGGSCDPKYSYQWQRSENGLNWTSITGAHNADLEFSETVIVNTYFRRVTFEASSNTTVYSDNALLTVVF